MAKMMMQQNLITHHVTKDDRKQQLKVVHVDGNSTYECEPIGSSYNEGVRVFYGRSCNRFSVRAFPRSSHNQGRNIING